MLTLVERVLFGSPDRIEIQDSSRDFLVDATVKTGSVSHLGKRSGVGRKKKERLTKTTRESFVLGHARPRGLLSTTLRYTVFPPCRALASPVTGIAVTLTFPRRALMIGCYAAYVFPGTEIEGAIRYVSFSVGRRYYGPWPVLLSRRRSPPFLPPPPPKRRPL